MNLCSYGDLPRIGFLHRERLTKIDAWSQVILSSGAVVSQFDAYHLRHARYFLSDPLGPVWIYREFVTAATRWIIAAPKTHAHDEGPRIITLEHAPSGRSVHPAGTRLHVHSPDDGHAKSSLPVRSDLATANGRHSRPRVLRDWPLPPRSAVTGLHRLSPSAARK